MWKSLITSGQQATRRICHQPPSLWTPPLGPAMKLPFSTSSRPQKDADNSNLKDRETLNPERTEGTKSGTDSEVAQHPTAYDPHNTAPESEMEAAGKEKHEEGQDRNPLNMSAANSDVSAWRDSKEGGPDRNVEKPNISGRGSSKKNRSIHVKEDGTHVSYKD
ncbi:uncharacterized protein N7484_004229 [Penicillium longicatenatum]|uniref:uncharacterized protein n=1 Tax=Penicillium longicatenatum TaxID=1561947 RepID=UPI0025493FF0|nr:uncharacterized protein N7484_004229 [Penicillium longicatenatum]KAJ5650506.1 hypothetical protein N7484_004229 [Penicillium longicatenatum]